MAVGFTLDSAWTLDGILKYGGLIIALAGVAIFGWYFVRINARAALAERSDIPAQSWRGRGALLGAKILALGIVVQVASFILGAMLPGRP